MDMNSFWIRTALEYHGIPLKSIWDGERGEQDLVTLGLTQLDYSTYRDRSKGLRFTDRGIRLKLHQFIAKNAAVLFDQNLVDSVSSTTPCTDPLLRNSKIPVVNKAPPFECFLTGLGSDRSERVLNTIRPGDLLYGRKIATLSTGSVIKGCCIVGRVPYYIFDLNLKIYTSGSEQYDRTGSHSGVLFCEIELVDKYNRIICKVLKEVRDYPEFFKEFNSGKLTSYKDYFDRSEDFKNPYCADLLYQDLGLDPNEHYTNMANARGRYPPQEYADDIRQKQASKLAFRSVAEGIEHFKEGRHSEAFQCLNKALSIDGRNVEGLVARGALYANSGSFKKAVEDFENALKLNPGHANARKYMGETLVALGRSYEDENSLEEAKKAYQDCLMIIPHHEEAQTSLDFLKSKMKGPLLIEPGELQLPELHFGDGSKKEEALSSKRTKEKKGKKKKIGKNKKKYSSSSSSASSDDNGANDSSDSSSDSTSNSSSSSSASDSAGKKRKKKDKKRVPSPTALIVGKGGAIGPAAPPPPAISNDYELKVRNFLSEMNRDEDNYEEKVRRFVEETSKYRKDREKASEKRRRRKKEKETKRTKKESKKKKREKSGKKDKKSKGSGAAATATDSTMGDEDKLREALKIFENFPILDELGSKLQSLYGKDKKEEKPPMLAPTQAAAAPESKWKMMFAKDTPSTSKTPVHASLTTSTSHSKSSLAKSAFADSDEERRRSRGGTKKSPSPVLVPIPPRPKYARLLSPASMNRPAPIRSGPVVLDKFGNFRLANAEPDPPGRRSRSRRRSSSSRSRSPRSHRRRSRSFRSRSRSRSSRSYSRSRSRSRSGERWGRRFRGGGGGFDRQPGNFKSRFGNNNNNNVGGRGGRGSRGGRDWEFRAGGRGFRPRGGRGNGGRFNDRFRPSRSRSFSPVGRRDRSPLRRSPDVRQKSPRHRSPTDTGRQRSLVRSLQSPGKRDQRRERERSRSKERRDRPKSPSPRKSASRRSPTPEKNMDRHQAVLPGPESEPATIPQATETATNPHNDDAEPPPPGCE